MGKKYAIFGIDPGATSAVCAVDLKGNLVGCRHAKEGGRETVSGMINSIGVPSAIATDKSVAPESVRKVAAGYNAALFVPSRELTEKEKSALASGKGFENNHLRDAYAAAFMAYRHYANKLRQIDSMGLGDAEEVKHMVINGSTMFSAIASLAAGMEPGMQEKELAKSGHGQERQGPRELLSRALSEIKGLGGENANLRKALSIEREKNAALSGELSRLRHAVGRGISSDPEVRRLRGRIARLENYIRMLKMRIAGPARKAGESGKSGGNSQKTVQSNKTLATHNNDDKGKTGIDIEKIINDYRVEKESE
ncbi:MAG: DUF460 domain-containing protein [Candidatus Micrarchaeia archaeon]